MDFFFLLFDDEILEMITHETNLYAQQNPPGSRYNWYDTCVSELKLLLGMIIIMGIHKLPAYSDYWSSDCLLGVPSIVSGMPLDRFKVLIKCLHINDNNKMKPRSDPDYDRLHKLRPLFPKLKMNILREYTPNQDLSVDEAMVGFKGRSSLKQYMPMKPTKRGFKVWSLCDSQNWYLCNFEVYVGATDSGNPGGLVASIVKKLTSISKQ